MRNNSKMLKLELDLFTDDTIGGGCNGVFISDELKEQTFFEI